MSSLKRMLAGFLCLVMLFSTQGIAYAAENTAGEGDWKEDVVITESIEGTKLMGSQYIVADGYSLRNEDGVLAYCYQHRTGVDVVIPEGVIAIAPSTFKIMDIRSVEIPDSVRRNCNWYICI